MTSTDVTTPQILGRVVATLTDTQQAWRDLVHGDEAQRQWTGLKNLVRSGRSVTFVLQKLSTREPDFADWYEPIRDEMRSDPMLKYFHDLRNEIEKEGLPQPVYSEIQVIARDGTVLMVADAAVGEDEHGIWVEGQVPRESVSYTAEQISSMKEKILLGKITLPGQPTEHLGESLIDCTFATLGARYISYLAGSVVGPARDKFGVQGR